MRRQIKLTIAYDGTNYSGFQIQKNGVGVSELVNKAVSRIANQPVHVLCVSRTDAGVHALGQEGTFFLEGSIPVENIPRATQGHLPEDIMILKAEEMPLDFYCIREAVGKHYRYVVRTSYLSNPFDHRFVWHYPQIIDLSQIKKAIPYLEGEHDFEAFAALHSGKSHFTRTVNNIYVTQKGEDYIFDIWGEGFLYKMVRSIVGFLIDVGRGHFPPEKALEVLASKNREDLGHTAPAKGLTLIKIYFNNQFYIDKDNIMR